MSHWIITSKSTRDQLGTRQFETRELAEQWMDRLGPVLADQYTPWYQHENIKLTHMINEGLVRDDLEGILLSKISIDEYVPEDPKSDNVVVALYIKGVPEAVQPMKNFLEHCNGVLQVDFGDSETIPDCSVLYVEFDRENMDITDLNAIIVQVSMLSGIKVGEFTMSFPNTDRKFPYSPKILQKYFSMRTKRANALAQKQAIISRTKELQDEIQKEISAATKGTKPPETEPEKPEDHPDHQKVDQVDQVGQDQQEQEEEQEKQAARAPGDKASTGNPVQAAQSAVGESLVNRLVGLFE